MSLVRSPEMNGRNIMNALLRVAPFQGVGRGSLTSVLAVFPLNTDSVNKSATSGEETTTNIRSRRDNVSKGCLCPLNFVVDCDHAIQIRNQFDTLD